MFYAPSLAECPDLAINNVVHETVAASTWSVSHEDGTNGVLWPSLTAEAPITLSVGDVVPLHTTFRVVVTD